MLKFLGIESKAEKERKEKEAAAKLVAERKQRETAARRATERKKQEVLNPLVARINPDALSTLSGHTDDVRALAVLSNGLLASGSYDKTIKIWNASGICVSTLSGHSKSVISLAVLSNGLLATSGDGPITLWNMEGSSVLTMWGHMGAIWVLLELSNGLLASGSSDNTIKLWNLESGSSVETLSGHTSSVRALAELSSDGLLASGSGDNTIKLWNLESGSSLSLATFFGHTGVVAALVELENGFLASGSYDKTVKIWNFRGYHRGSCVSTLSGHTSAVMSLAVISNGLLLVSGSLDSTIKIWNTTDACVVSTLSGHTTPVYALTMLSNGLLASGSTTDIKFWDVGVRSVMAPVRKKAAKSPQIASSHSVKTASVVQSPVTSLDYQSSKVQHCNSEEGIEEFIRSQPSVAPHKPSIIEEYVARQEERDEEERRQHERDDTRKKLIKEQEFYKYQREMAGGVEPSESEVNYQRQINKLDGSSDGCRIS